MSYNNSIKSKASTESYATIDRKEGSFFVLEIEHNSIQESDSIPFIERETFIALIPESIVVRKLGNVKEGDIIVVKKSGGVSYPVRIAEDEKARRIEFLKSLL